jgi:hypothetical protein
MALCFWTSKVFDRFDNNRKAWTAIGFGTLFWSIGQLILTFKDGLYEAISGTPIPENLVNLIRDSSDVFYIISIPIIALGFYYLGKTFKTQIPIYGWILAIVVFIGSMTLSIINNWGLVFPVDPANAMQMDMLIFTILYAVLYPFLLSYAVLMVSIIFTGMLGRPWIFVLSGIILYSIGEILWYNIEQGGIYVAGGYFDLLWLGGFILIGIGAYVNYYMIKHPY